MRGARLLGTAFIILSLAVASAPGADGSYSSIAAKQCRKLAAVKIGDTVYAASRVCPGRGGYQVYIDEEDLRETLTVGKTLRQAAREPAAVDQFGAFNGYDDTVEWRLGNGGKPYALIVGWSFADNETLDTTGRPKEARLLVVMRLPPGPVCKIAIVDRVANPDANALARKAADQRARNFNCGSDPLMMVGKSGAAAAAFLRLQERQPPKP